MELGEYKIIIITITQKVQVRLHIQYVNAYMSLYFLLVVSEVLVVIFQGYFILYYTDKQNPILFQKHISLETWLP